ncbi:hypothetical protein KIK06_10345 [Nocardiopsis sp. EMB25]|uniref:hypothetical protein n=1 Tax=Nocardiopsis sp. EMB25 TaxID=2835867 RepID=UPI0022833B0B|nr:hypothetical protein [Nocardiopsis sp. EMB25]MCY9784291.1 hypothetical protein [Nocardiopsis sp. EMB25]
MGNLIPGPEDPVICDLDSPAVSMRSDSAYRWVLEAVEAYCDMVMSLSSGSAGALLAAGRGRRWRPEKPWEGECRSAFPISE